MKKSGIRTPARYEVVEEMTDKELLKIIAKYTIKTAGHIKTIERCVTLFVVLFILSIIFGACTVLL